MTPYWELWLKAGKANSASKSPAPAVAKNAPTLDVGVYYKKNGSWVLLPPEALNWKTGGVLKNMATMHIVKGI